MESESLWTQQEWLVIDSETTGLSKEKDRIVDLAAVQFRHGEVVDSWESLLDPKMPIPESSTEIHGITDEMVQGQPSFEEISADFLAQVARADVLVAYNWPFDAGFLKTHIGAERWSKAIAGKALLDPMVVVRFDKVGRYWKGRGRHRLTQVCERLEIECPGTAHRARTDAIMAGHVLWKLRSHLPKKALEATLVTIEQRERQEADFQTWRKSKGRLF
jgi:DNA polymerase-3 subunit alpha (Gram-positive type)